MFNAIKQLIKSNPKIQLFLLLGLVVQVVTSVTAVGFFHPDQHFQLLEFSSYQLGKANSAASVWELKAMIRPTLQVYLFSGYEMVCGLFKLTDPYTQMTILRLIVSIAMLLLFNIMLLFYLKNETETTIFYALLLLNFSWCFPYVRSLFSSEIMSSLVFFGTVFWYDLRKQKPESIVFLLLVGFLLCVSFYLRFQIGFAIAGFGVWLLLVEKKYAAILPLAIGFAVGAALNTYLDYGFYHHWVFTPYQYYYSNIVEGKAAAFGTASFLVYIAVLVAVIAAPPSGIILFWYGLKASFKNIGHPIVITVVFFIIGHCFVGHKEERFLYPIFNALPIITGLGLGGFINFYSNCKKWMRYCINGILIFSVSLNIFLLFVFMVTPYSQTVYFSYLIKEKFKGISTSIYCIQRTPFETENGLPLTFYQKNAADLNFKKIDSVGAIQDKNLYVATTFNQSRDDKFKLDSLGYKQVTYSSNLLWGINQFLCTKNINSINDIWVLYKKDK